MARWSADKKLQELRNLTQSLFADVEDIERLYVKINATVKGHVDWVELDEIMGADDFHARMCELNEALLQTAQRLSPLAWALDDDCESLFGIQVSELSSRLQRLSEISSSATEDYKTRHFKGHRPKHVAIDRLILGLAHIYFEVRRTPPTFRRKNGQVALSQPFVSLLQAIYAVLPHDLNFRSSSENAFIGRAKRSASHIECNAEVYRPFFYRESAA